MKTCPLAIFVLALSAAGLRADLLQMQNGDRYAGKILSVNSNSIVLQSEVLGEITVPRGKVSNIQFGAAAVSHTPATSNAAPAVAGTNADLSAAFRSLGADTNFIGQVRQQLLAGSPEANQKYDQMVGDLMSGKMNLSDLRNQARTSIEQINQLKKELGPDAGDSLDGYLEILENFVNDTPSDSPSATVNSNAPPAAGVNTK
jgi:hypothetical protein